MTQQYTHSITKEAISELPLEEFTGRIIVIDTLRDVEKAVGYLSEFQSVGFDTETRQVCTGCLKKLKMLLRNQEILLQI